MCWSICTKAPNFWYATLIVLLSPPDPPLLEHADSVPRAVRARTTALAILRRCMTFPLQHGRNALGKVGGGTAIAGGGISRGGGNRRAARRGRRRSGPSPPVRSSGRAGRRRRRSGTG